MFYTGTNPNTTPYYNTWNAKNKALQSDATSIDNIVVKTIYDPSPVGYTVAPVNAFSKFTTVNWDSTNKGSLQQGCWFPALGFRLAGSSALSNVGDQSRTWQAVPYNANSGRDIWLASGTANPVYYASRAYGMSVCPVAEIESSGN